MCPPMIQQPLQLPDTGQRHGPTPLHLMIVKEANSKAEKQYKYKILRKMVTCMDETKTFDLSTFNLKGEWSKGHIFRGKTVLNIAARTLDMKVIKFLLTPTKQSIRPQAPVSFNSDNGNKDAPVCFDSYNEYKDNMFHSLIRYTIFCPEKENQIVSFMEQIEELLNTNAVRAIDKSKEVRPERLWSMRNHENLTPLQLAVKFGRTELFKFILNRKVYRLNSGDMGTFDDDPYNVTEIDTLPVKDIAKTSNQKADIERAKQKKVEHISILHLLEKNCPDKTSVGFVSHKVVMKVIAEKWRYYEKWFVAWSLLHFLTMCLHSWQAVVRSRLRNPIRDQSATIPEYDNVAFVIASNCFVLVYGILCIFMQCQYYYFYCYMNRESVPFYDYCHVFFLFGLSIVVDFILMFSTSSYYNFILPFIAIIGWYLSIYFLHVLESFSFFTVLIKQVVRHLVDFGVIMAALLLGFSIAMFVVMQDADDIEEDTFENLEKTIVKMFTIMLGIGELGVLFNARYPILAIIIFCLFVLLTTILLLNALIAIMSNTCSELTGGVTKKAYVRLQRMYTIIDLEAMLPRRFLHGSGEEVERQTIKERLLSLRPEEEENDDEGHSEKNRSEKILNQILNALFGHSEKTKRKRKPHTLNRAVAPTESAGQLDIYEMRVRE